MGLPKDRLAEMQKAAYFEDEDDCGIQIKQETDGNFTFNYS